MWALITCLDEELDVFLLETREEAVQALRDLMADRHHDTIWSLMKDEVSDVSELDDIDVWQQTKDKIFPPDISEEALEGFLADNLIWDTWRIKQMMED